jgi:hypothetical protein
MNMKTKTPPVHASQELREYVSYHMIRAFRVAVLNYTYSRCTSPELRACVAELMLVLDKLQRFF